MPASGARLGTGDRHVGCLCFDHANRRDSKMLFGIGSSSKGSKDKGRADEERSPLLGQGSTASVGVRHGRGLMSDEDEDDDDDRQHQRQRRAGQGRGNGAARTIAADNRSNGDLLSAGSGEHDEEEDDGLLSPHHRSSRRRASNGDLVGDDDDDDDGRTPAYTWRSVLCYGLLVFLGVAFIVFAVLHVWVGRFVSEQFKNDGALLRARAQDATIVRGPDRVQILHMDADSTTVQLDMRMGVDVRTVFGWNDHVRIQERTSGREQQLQMAAAQQLVLLASKYQDDEGKEDKHLRNGKKGKDEKQKKDADRPKKLSLVRRWERQIIGWATRHIGQATMDLPQPVLLSPQASPSSFLAQLALDAPVTIPLWFPKKDYDPMDESWLNPVSLTVPIEVLNNDLMASFIKNAMDQKRGSLHVTVRQANVALGRQDDRSFLARIVKKYGGKQVQDVQSDVAFEVPDSPETPKDPAALVDLLSYDLLALPHNVTHHNRTRTSESLGIHATARIENPAYQTLRNLSLNLDIPFAWPYSVYLPSTDNKSYLVPFASGVLEPFTIPYSSKHFNVSINGTVANSANSSTPLSQSLAKFVQRFLSGKPNRAFVAFDGTSPFAARLPSFLLPLLKPLKVSYDIPGLPADERDLLKNLQFKDMHIHAADDGSGGFQLDGILQGELTLPPGLDKLDNPINITEIWPDILMYDGTPPQGEEKKLPPSPTPPNAFARFRTKDWAPAVTEKIHNNDDKDSATTTVMRSTVTNAPLEILNRGVLQRWLAKIIFSGGNGVRTGVKGLTRARATMRAFGDIQLDRLPVLGIFYANKPNFLQQGEASLHTVQEWLFEQQQAEDA